MTIDELIEARARVAREDAERKGGGARSPAPAAPAEDISLPRLIGLWLICTGLIVLKVAAMLLATLAEMFSE